MLNIHPQISDEILEYYYSIATWKLIFSHAFNFFRVDPDLKGLERSATLGRLRKVEIVFYCDVLILRDYRDPRDSGGGGAMKSFCDEIRKRADRACEVLLQAAKLRAVTVSWIDTTGCGTPSDVSSSDTEDPWMRKYTILAPLRKLLQHPGGLITFKIGHVNGLARDWFMRAMEDVVGERHERRDQKVGKLEPGLDGAGDEREQATKLRMLAFDVRQDRHLLHREQEQALYWGQGI